MGLFSIFKSKPAAAGQDRELARLQKMISNKLSQNLDRQAALERLAVMGTKEAAQVLLQRFTWTLDPSITDQEEKAIAVEGLVKAGKNALDPIRNFCKNTQSMSWPLKALRQIVTGKELEAEMLGLITYFDTDYQRNPEPKIQLLQALEEFPSEEISAAVEPFLTDSNEAVRFTAVTTLFHIGQERAIPSLMKALSEDESLRIRNRIAQGLVEQGWKIPSDLEDSCRASLPPGFSLAESQVVGALRA